MGVLSALSVIASVQYEMKLNEKTTMMKQTEILRHFTNLVGDNTGQDELAWFGPEVHSAAAGIRELAEAIEKGFRAPRWRARAPGIVQPQRGIDVLTRPYLSACQESY